MAALRSCAHTFVFAAYPVLVVAGANAGVLPLDGPIVLRSAAITLALTALLLLALRPLVRDLTARAAVLSFFFIGLSLYVWIGGLSTALLPAALHTIVCAAAAVLIVRPWRPRERSAMPMNAAAAVVLAANVYSCAPAALRSGADGPAADALIASVVAASRPVARGPRPDIYHVVLDGFGRPDVLKDRFGLDLEPLVEALRARGFIVPPGGRSNYAQTYLSLGSTLNLSYLDPVVGSLQDSGDRRVLDRLIQRNALTALARQSGYRVVAIGSDYTATEWLGAADDCLCERYGLHEIEATALSLTPFRAVVPDGWTYGAHRDKVAAGFRHLREAASRPGPKLVFTHVLAPHPPFVFEADGRPRAVPDRVFSLTDGSQFTGSGREYVEGYRAQAAYVAREVLAAVDAILARNGEAVILLHGDHGPGSTRDAGYVTRESARERMAIFSAYRLPGAEAAGLPDDVSPISALRVVANRYLGGAFPPLPDRSYASSWERPYRFVLVAPDAGPAPLQLTRR